MSALPQAHTHELIQGSAEWHAFRAQYFTASDAGAMLGVSPYKSRSDLLREKATGLQPDIDAATQARFDDGHRFEDLARPLAEQLINDALYRAVMSRGQLAASFDGITMLEDTIWEHKTLNRELRGIERAEDLPLHYRAQIEQALYVSGAERCLFMASCWTKDNELAEDPVYIWVISDPALRQRIIDGWEQFAEDLKNYKPTISTPKPIGRTPESLPALRIEIAGNVLASNVPEFKAHALQILEGIKVDLHTDADFADAEKTAKWCKEVEDRLEAARQHALSQTQTINDLFKAIDEIKDAARSKRLMLEKLVKTRKDEIKEALILAAKAKYTEQIMALSPHGYAPQIAPPNFAAAIKGLKNLSSIQNAIDTALADSLSMATRAAQEIKAKLEWYEQAAAGHEMLFADLAQIIHKPEDDFKLTVSSRIAQLQAKQAQDETPAQDNKPSRGRRPPGPAMMTLADINARLKFMVTVPFLKSIGIAGESCDYGIAYKDQDFPMICQAIANYCAALAEQATHEVSA